MPPEVKVLPEHKQIEWLEYMLKHFRKEKEDNRLYKEYKQTIQKNYKHIFPELLTLKQSFFVPSFWNTIFPADQSTDKSNYLKILTEESPGIFAFDMLTPEYCEKLLAEIENFEKWCIEHHLKVSRPNSMNNYGAILDDFGFSDILQEWVNTFITPFVTHLYPHLAEFELEDHHGFVVEYKMGKDEKLDFHVDDSEVTLNVCLGRSFKEGTLFFEGVRCEEHQQTPPKKTEHFIYPHKAGKAIFHLGKHRHGANPIIAGERYNLILWCRSADYRESPVSHVHGPWCGW